MSHQICVEVNGEKVCFPLYMPIRWWWEDPNPPDPRRPDPDPWRDLFILNALVDVAGSLSARIGARDELVQMAQRTLQVAVEDLGVGAELRMMERPS
ncbi:hypothetical protein [Agromyces binzhouensis]|uniref:Uncharacterized protein n=1 Tax=Agromyces binzhouensis TaxID=1817495 RepID=A0A4Q2JPD4_9MICO|nr:hypothetical protein [Agromyces binzhouensis]RXZ48080.1 hypothetical protein ESO86_08305 [Agromyces binzhouensis]